MAKTVDSVKKIPTECVETINSYAKLIWVSFQNEKELQREEMARKLRGYLTCLVDLGLLTHLDERNIYSWVISGHYVGDKEGRIDD